MKLKIRKITNEDLDEILSLALKTPELHTQDGDPEYYSKEQLQGFIKNPDVIFLGAFDKYVDETYLINLVVTKNYEHRGIGQSLFKKALNTAKEKGHG